MTPPDVATSASAARSGGHQAGKGASSEADGLTPELSQTVVAAATSILHAHTATPPISNSAYYGKPRKRVPKAQQSWKAPRTANQHSHHSLAGQKDSLHTHNSYSSSSKCETPGSGTIDILNGKNNATGANRDDLMSIHSSHQPQQDLQKRLYASGDAREQILVSDRALVTGATLKVEPLATSGKQSGTVGTARSIKPRRLADLNTGLKAPGELSLQVSDLSLRHRIQAPLGYLVPPAAEGTGRSHSRQHKHRKAVNYTMYNTQRFAEAEHRKREMLFRKVQAAAAARAMAGAQNESGVLHEPPPGEGICKW